MGRSLQKGNISSNIIRLNNIYSDKIILLKTIAQGNETIDKIILK